jgi:molecular chaperone DnaK
MVKDAEAHSSDDKARREHSEKKNNLDSMVYQAEKTLEETAEKLDDALKSDIAGAIETAKQDLESDDGARLDAGLQRLQTELHKVAEILYKAEAAQADAGEPGSDAGSSLADEDVIDAEYTEASEEKSEEG